MAEKVINSKLCLRSDSTDNWVKVNPVLLKGELGIEEDTYRIKIGDGIKSWNELPYYFGMSREEIFDLIYPIDSVLVTVNNVNPSERIGGVWRETKVIAITEMKYWVRVE